jgi:hypothetical protein
LLLATFTVLGGLVALPPGAIEPTSKFAGAVRTRVSLTVAETSVVPLPSDPWVGGGAGGDGGGTGGGALNGLMVTLKPALPTLPEASLAVQVTAVVPTGNVESDGGVQVTAGDAGPTVSVADAVNVATAPAELVASRVMFAGTVTTGGVVSRTVTVNDLAPVFPFPSEAVQFTVVAPTGKTEPEFFEQLTGRDPVTMSVAVAAV